MARDRQRSKQRQAERRARRLEQQGGETPPDLGGPAVDPELAMGAPPEEEGPSWLPAATGGGIAVALLVAIAIAMSVRGARRR